MKTGKLPESILKRSVLGKIKKRRNEVLKGAGIGGDCAFLALKSENGKGTGQGEKTVKSGKELEAIMAVSTETVALPVKNAAYLAVMAAANNVAVGGGRPVSVMLSVTLPEETEEAQLRELMGEAERCCGELGIQIAGGHTEVSSYVNCPVITATVIGAAAMGEIPAQPQGTEGLSQKSRKADFEEAEKQMPGIPREMSGNHKLDIVMSKWIGLEGTCILAGEKEKELLTRYPVRLVNEAKAQEKYLSVASEAEIALGQGVYAMHDLRYGGVFGALWELSQKTGMGFCVDLKRIPVKQETIEVCEFFGLNPYELLSGGALLMASEDGAGLTGELAEAGISSVVIGSMDFGNDKIVRNGEEIRYLGRPGQDEILKI